MDEIHDRPTDGELESVIDLMCREQARPDRCIASLANSRKEIRAELDAMEPDWRRTVRVGRTPSGAIDAAIVTEWNFEARRAWIHGPWIDCDDDHWQLRALDLIGDATARLPAFPNGTPKTLITADSRHRLLSELSSREGWKSGEPNDVMEASASTVAGWRDATGHSIRKTVPADEPAVRRLHDAEFPDTYYTARQLMERAASGEELVMVADGPDGRPIAYAAGRVQADGDGYIDFIAVDDRHRRRAVARSLLTAIANELVAAAPNRRVCLTVEDSRVGARSLYASLGFTTEISIVGYETSAAE